MLILSFLRNSYKNFEYGKKLSSLSSIEVLKEYMTIKKVKLQA